MKNNNRSDKFPSLSLMKGAVITLALGGASLGCKTTDTLPYPIFNQSFSIDITEAQVTAGEQVIVDWSGNAGYAQANKVFTPNPYTIRVIEPRELNPYLNPDQAQGILYREITDIGPKHGGQLGFHADCLWDLYCRSGIYLWHGRGRVRVA